MTSAHSLELSALAVQRGEQRLFEALSLSLSGGDLATIVGPNGAGKTSLMRVVAGLSQPEQGEVRWNGRPIASGDPEFARDRLYLGHLAGLKGELSVIENLRFLVSLQGGHNAAQDIVSCLEALGLGHALDAPVRQLSAGQRRRAALARLRLSECPLWLLDEPLTNLDIAGQTLIGAWLQQHLDAGGIALVASHAPLDVAVPGRMLKVALGP